MKQPRNKRSGIVLWTWIALVVLLVSACAPAAAPGQSGGEAAAPASETQDTVVVLQGVDMTTMDPHFAETLTESSLMKHIYQTLFIFDDQGNLVPDMAESYTAVDDLTWEFKIKEGYTFHNGEVVNAEAFAFTLNRGLDLFNRNEGRVSYEYSLLNLDRVEVVDEYTLRLITQGPVPIMPIHLAHTQTAAQPPEHTANATLEELNAVPIGSGPYRFVEWIPEERVVIEAWEDFKDGMPAIKTIIWRPVPEAATRIAELQAGNAHIIANVPPDLGDALDAADGVHLATVEGWRRIFVGIRQDKHPALTDKRVRQALNYAFNCEGMMENLLAGRGTCSAHIINSPNGSPNVTSYGYDPDRARELLAEAGWTDTDGDGILDKDGEKLSLGFDSPNSRYIKDREIAQVIASDLEAIGIEIDLQVYDWSVFSPMTAQRGAGLRDLYLLGSGPGFECQADLALVQRDSGSNRSLWSNDEFEAIWEQMNSVFDPEERIQMCHQLEEIAFEEAPLIFIWLQTDFYGVADSLNWSPRADERIVLLNASFE